MVGTIDIENDKLRFTLTGVDKVLALKSELKVPLTHVKSVSTEKVDWNYFTMLKLAGARLPHVIASGTFLGKDLLRGGFFV